MTISTLMKSPQIVDLSQSQDPWGPKVGLAGPVGVPEWGRPGFRIIAAGRQSGLVAGAVRRSPFVLYPLSALRSLASYRGLSWVCVSRFRVGSGRGDFRVGSCRGIEFSGALGSAGDGFSDRFWLGGMLLEGFWSAVC